jgi:hypothetical protein
MLYRGNSAPSASSQPRRFRHRRRPDAALRAITGAKLLLGAPVRPKTQAEAAELVGSNRPYIAAAAMLLEAEVPALIEDVLLGEVSLLGAAASIRKKARLVKAYREANRSDRRALGKAVGIDAVFDEIIAPLL